MHDRDTYYESFDTLIQACIRVRGTLTGAVGTYIAKSFAMHSD